MQFYKRITAVLSFCFLCAYSIYAQSLTFCYKGAWCSWIPNWNGYTYSSSTLYDISRYTDGSGFVLTGKYTRIEFFTFRINYYMPPSKDEIKRHLKNNQWYEYTGTVEYYVNDIYPTAEDIAKAQKFVEPDPRVDKTPNVKRTARATIKIAPYKKQPECYNIWFDDIGVGIDVQTVKFSGQSKRHRGRVVANIAWSVFLFPIGIASWWLNPVKD